MLIIGRKKKLTDVTTKHLTNKEIEERKEEEEVLFNYRPLNFLDVPKTLDTVGKKEWKRLANVISDLPISELDRSIMTNYCMYVSLLEKARKELNKSTLITEEGKKNPLIDVINGSNKELKSLAGTMGLTVDSRMRIKAPTKEKEKADPFKDLFEEVDNND